MCGRFTQSHSKRDLQERFNIPDSLFQGEISERYNIAPSQLIPVIVPEPNDGDLRALLNMKWGLVPGWAKDPAIGNKMINAKAETLLEKPSFRDPFRKRRCLIPADGFYEWRKEGKHKQPLHIRRKDKGLFAFAGLFEPAHPGLKEVVGTCTIITAEPNELLMTIHHRMAVILTPDDEEVWLNPKTSIERARECLRPYPLDDLVAIPVSREVNSPGAQGPSCIEPMTSGS